MKKLWSICKERSFIIMITGFIVAIGGILFFMNHRYGIPGRISFGVTVAGVALYILGRILVIIHRRERKSMTTRSDNEEL